MRLTLQRISNAIASGLRALGKALPALARDAAGLAGATLIAYGAWLVFPAAGYIVGGVLLISGALLTARGGGS